MTECVLFVGPSLAGVAVPPGITRLGPAMAGDLYRAARSGARVIGLVDGVFGDRPTVWHKEILWALDKGVRVIGAASLGALRAAECASFGMEGLGSVYARCADGSLEDDHALAVLYAPAELDFRPLTEALVNVEATLAAAEAAAILSPMATRQLGSLAQSLPFQSLTWRTIIEASGEDGPALERWLPGGRIDVKRADALQLVGALVASAPSTKSVRFDFADTRYWREAARWFERRGGAGVSPREEGVLDELRLNPTRFERRMLRAFAQRAAAEAGADVETDAGDLIDTLRDRLGLATAAEFRGWLARSETDVPRLADALTAEDRLGLALEQAMPTLTAAVLDGLRVDGKYPDLARRAADKEQRLAEIAISGYHDGVLRALLIEFSTRRRVSIDTDDLDLVARSLGLEDRRALYRLLQRESEYSRTLAQDGG